jgi:MOSC domain-containing protein YiiM
VRTAMTNGKLRSALMIRATHLFAGPVRSLRSPRVPGAAPTSWRSAILRAPVTSAISVGPTGLDGDAQHDLRHHGGPSKALLCYSAAHYPAWREAFAAHIADNREALMSLTTTFDASVMGPGAFGENLTIDGLDETTVCLGDVWRVGRDVVIVVSEPRGPCGTLARRWMRPSLVSEVNANAKAGWYVSVSTGGEIAPGAPCELLDRPAPAWTMARVYRVTVDRGPAADIRALLAFDWLVPPLRERLERRL